MIRHSPILLIAAAQALVPEGSVGPCADARRMPPGDATGMQFVHRAGYWSHFDAKVGVSSWPLDVRWTLGEVHAVAAQHGMLQLDGSPGDLLIRCNAQGVPTRVGVVLAAVDRLQLPGEAPTWTCHALWEGGHAPRTSGGSDASMDPAVRESPWFQGGRGDRFLPWYWMPHFSRVAPRRAA